MMLKRLARRWNPEKALKGETKYHLFSARSFLTAMYGDAMVEEITEAWKKTSPVELNAYRTDAECNCGIDGCEACETKVGAGGTAVQVELLPANAKGQRGAACGASAAPTGCASNGNHNERTEK